ncbi:GntR family transcriptional regulator [Sedimentisphaera salicampi]|uniref:GntR family transcriptional regulator n=1 Tax=Sedimentisphaera salicampi TaxID=1941349 RepID=UPI000B9B70F5|nr:GntR family transcriptional regulator [Sedimentisphaera salicampi]OXU14805.1 HTH-type transcriptional repressor YtrA [Sedimentisphaera salicampi]
MIINIDTHSGIPIYRQITSEIKNLILSGTLTEGEQMPSVRELSAQLRVNPMTVSKAYANLEMEGFFERRRGVGMFVNPQPEAIREESGEQIIKDNLKSAVSQARSFGISKSDLTKIVQNLYDSYSDGEKNE